MTEGAVFTLTASDAQVILKAGSCFYKKGRHKTDGLNLSKVIFNNQANAFFFRQHSKLLISSDSSGESKQINKFAGAAAAREDRKGKSLSYKVGSFLGSSISTAGKNKKKLEDEQNYYDALEYIIDAVIG